MTAIEAAASPSARKAHAWLIESASAENRRKISDNIAKTALCENAGADGNFSAGDCACRHCKKFPLHPDVTRIAPLTDDSGKPRREILISQIRELIADSAALPNEAAVRVYIIDEADKMNLSAQNALLRLLEEPPKQLILVLCAENSGRLCGTIRSRCVLLRENAVSPSESAESRAYAAELIKLMAEPAKNARELDQYLTARESLDTAGLLSLVRALRELLAEKIRKKNTEPDISPARALSLYNSLKTAEAYLDRSVGPKHVLGYLRTI